MDARSNFKDNHPKDRKRSIISKLIERKKEIGKSDLANNYFEIKYSESYRSSSLGVLLLAMNLNVTFTLRGSLTFTGCLLYTRCLACVV